MGIEDIQISEELETNAPSIKYSGDEGPKSPQQIEQMMMAQLEEEYAKYVFEMQEQGLEPMSMQQFMEQAMAEGQMAGGNPLPQDPTKPVNPFQPKPTGPVLPDRQMAAYGGIMGMDGRKRYGLGSIKDRLRKLIPNEIAEVAVKAAPFVAPFNPIAAGLMSGIGGFDQTGRIGSSIKSGLMNYGLGQAARMAGGAGFQKGLKAPGTGTGFGSYFTSPTTGKQLFGQKIPGLDSTNELKRKIAASKTKDPNLFEAISFDEMSGETPININQAKIISDNPISSLLNKAVTSYKNMSPLAKGAIGAGAITALLNMGPDKTVDEIMNRGEGLDIKGIRAEVIEAFKDPSGDKLSALRVKYPYLGRADTKDMSAMAMGGRIGKAEGGIMDLGGMEKDYRSEGGFVPIGREEKADDVPARLSVNEFVFTADAVRNAGGGDIDKGAEIMENMMKNLEARWTSV